MNGYAMAVAVSLAVGVHISAAVSTAAPARPLKVFVMVGQSNMVGHGYFEAKNQTTGEWLNGTLGYLAQHPRTKEEFSKLVDSNGGWVHRDDVFIINDVNALGAPAHRNQASAATRWSNTLIGLLPRSLTVHVCMSAVGNASDNPPPRITASRAQSGNIGAFLAPGWGGESTSIGPELGFGWAVGDALTPPVLLLKVAWGGKTLGADFRPPSSGGTVGPYYTWMVKKVRKYLADLDAYLPPRSGANSYELAGFVRHQVILYTAVRALCCCALLCANGLTGGGCLCQGVE